MMWFSNLLPLVFLKSVNFQRHMANSHAQEEQLILKWNQKHVHPHWPPYESGDHFSCSTWDLFYEVFISEDFNKTPGKEKCGFHLAIVLDIYIHESNKYRNYWCLNISNVLKSVHLIWNKAGFIRFTTQFVI